MTDSYMHVVPRESRRAQRFAIRLTVRYRPEGREQWYQGEIENISAAGVLFEAERAVAAKTPIEFEFVLPPTMRDELSADVVCRGEIVRTLPASEERNIPEVAATITSYHFQRRGLPDR